MPTYNISDRLVRHVRNLERLCDEDRRIIEKMTEKWANEREPEASETFPDNVVRLTPRIA
jgi:hypothetical protein